MKRTIIGITILMIFLMFSCNRKNQESKNETENNQTEQLEKSVSKIYENIISKNNGKYPSEIKLFGNNEISDRLKELTGANYKEIVEKFNVETPIVSENSIYKLTGCLKHNCPAYMITILYDSIMDNLNVIVDRNGKIMEFKEKEKIHLTETLKRK
ncbi:hypothetical protein [Polaribacter atrinae]|uniref:hypothetical protein n=1 Tax=Polaribacter atrinae TaxID=1333662 RepID=UPI0030FB498C